MKTFLDEAKELKEELLENRRTLHGYAEVGFDLPKTYAFVEKKLREYGYDPIPVGQRGLVCLAGKPGKTILLRADMDALPMPEENGLPFAATNGHHHACGHDTHTAMLLAAAKLLKRHEAELQGTVKFMFQPAEELLSGAKDMIANGLLEDPHVDVAMAIHSMPGQDYCRTGNICLMHNGVTNSGDGIRITIEGRDAHGSTPYLGVDAVSIAAHTILALQELIAREIPLEEASTVLVGRIEGGTTCNSVAGYAVLEVSLRTPGPAQREFLMKRIEEVAAAEAALFRGKATVERMYGGIPALVNDETLLNECISYMGEILSEEALVEVPKMGGGEDFTMVAEQVPAVFLMLGAGSPEEGYEVSVHNLKTRFNEEALPIGAAVYAQCAMRWLEEHTK